MFEPDIDELLILEIRMLGYQFDFAAVEKRIIKMTDSPDKPMVINQYGQ